MRQNVSRNKFRNGAQKTVPESAGLVGDDFQPIDGVTASIDHCATMEVAIAADSRKVVGWGVRSSPRKSVFVLVIA